jgi:nucleoid DNA-binding protein
MARAIAEETGLTQGQAGEVILRVFEGITQALLTEGRIELRNFGVFELRNFGVFEVKQRKPRRGRNPRTGDRVKVPAKMVVTFRPGREMGERVGRLKAVPDGAASAASE